MAELETVICQYQKKVRVEKIELLRLELPRKRMIELLIEFQQTTKQRRLSAKTLARLVVHFERDWKNIEEFFDEVEGLKMPIDRWCELRAEAEKMPPKERQKWQNALEETADLRAEILHHTADLVPKIRMSIAGYDTRNADDMESVGFIGLIKAMENFDVERGVPFGAYARSWIYNTMVQYLRKDKLVNPSEKVMRSLRLYDRTFTDLQTKLGREPEEIEVAEAMNMSTDELQSLLEIDTGTTSLDITATDDEDYSLHEVLGAEEAAPYEEMEGRAFIHRIQDHLKALEGMEHSIVQLRWFPINESRLQGQPMTIDDAIEHMQKIALKRLLLETPEGRKFAPKYAT